MAFNLPPPPSTDDISGAPWRIWFFRLVQSLSNALDLTNVTGTLGVQNGGTGLSTVPSDNQILLGNGTGYDLKTLLAGSNITFDETTNTITINATSGSGKIYEPVVGEGYELMFSEDGDILMAWGGDYAS